MSSSLIWKHHKDGDEEWVSFKCNRCGSFATAPDRPGRGGETWICNNNDCKYEFFVSDTAREIAERK